MNLSRFFGATSREAMRQVRMALGPDALIVSNRRVNGGVEIMATDQTSEPELVAASEPEVVRRPRAQESSGADVVGAIGAMRGVLEARMDEMMWANHLRRAPQAVSLFQALLSRGFSTALLRAMLKRLPGDLQAKAAWEWARGELTKHLPVLESEQALWKPGVAVALVGPTGVGKTTTIAKLAARCVARFGSDKVVLLTTDTYRIGAHEQLKIYGEIMSVPVHVVQNAEELGRVVAGVAPEQLVLIDNIGISQRDHYVAEQAAMLASAGRLVNRLLVLNASSHGDTLDEVARVYSNDGGTPLRGCVITKVDEAPCLGACLDTAVRYRLPVCYVSNGQKVPENLLFLGPQELVERALTQPLSSHALYAPTEADFAALLAMTKAPQNEPSEVAAKTRRRLLPSLLTAVGGEALLTGGDLEQACAYLDETVASSEAYDLWRGYAVRDGSDRPLSLRVARLLRCAQNGASRAGCGRILAVHDRVALGAESEVRGQLHATFLLDDRARPLVSPFQQLALPQGWQSSSGESALAPPSLGDALRSQVRFIQDGGGFPAVHLFEGGSQSAWRALSAAGVSWLTQSRDSVRIVDGQDCPSTVGAVAKTLDYRPLALADGGTSLGYVCGVSLDEAVIWVGHANVALNSRLSGIAPVRIVSVRIISRHDGAVLKIVHGLSNIAEGGVSADTLALWLVAQSESKAVLRYAARLWRLLGESAQSEPELRRVLVASQLGLAVWQAMQCEGAGAVRRALHALAGRAALTAPTAASVMMKLFALKQMMA